MIPLLDIRAQYAGIREELDAAVLETLASGAYVSGPRVEAFERGFAAYCGAREAIALNSGTSALHLALLALGIGPGDEVITTAMTFVATVAAIRYAGATPVLVDADPQSFNIDPALIERAITPRTRAIIPVHLHGRLAEMDAIMAVADRHGIPVIEDAAQAHGAELGGRRAGTFGAIGCFSFYPGKNLGACGEGGGVVTDHADAAAAMRQLRDWGQAGRYNHVLHGFNYRMDGIQGAILEVKLRHLPAWTEGRRRVARIYDRLLAGSGILTPAAPAGDEHVYHVYAIRSAMRDRLADGRRPRDADDGGGESQHGDEPGTQRGQDACDKFVVRVVWRDRHGRLEHADPDDTAWRRLGARPAADKNEGRREQCSEG